MQDKLITQLKICKLSNSKPNFAELGREYDVDWRTVKRYYDGYEGKPKHRNKPSKLDKSQLVGMIKIPVFRTITNLNQQGEIYGKECIKRI